MMMGKRKGMKVMREIICVGAREGEINSNLTSKLSSREINRDLLSDLNHRATGIFNTRHTKIVWARECRCCVLGPAHIADLTRASEPYVLE